MEISKYSLIVLFLLLALLESRISAQMSNSIYTPEYMKLTKEPVIHKNPGEVDEEPIKLTYDWGSTGQLTCNFSRGFPIASVQWLFNGYETAKCDMKYVITANATQSKLTFKRLNSDYTGNYTCRVQNQIGVDNLEFQVEVCIPWSKILLISISVGIFCFGILIGVIVLFIRNTLKGL